MELIGKTVTLYNENNKKYKVIHIYIEDTVEYNHGGGNCSVRDTKILLQNLEKSTEEEGKESGEFTEHYSTKIINIEAIKAILYTHPKKIKANEITITKTKADSYFLGLYANDYVKYLGGNRSKYLTKDKKYRLTCTPYKVRNSMRVCIINDKGRRMNLSSRHF